LPAAEKNILEIFVDETKVLRSCHGRKGREDKNGVKENLQMKKIWIKTEDWHTPPLLKRKRKRNLRLSLGKEETKGKK